MLLSPFLGSRLASTNDLITVPSGIAADLPSELDVQEFVPTATKQRLKHSKKKEDSLCWSSESLTGRWQSEWGQRISQKHAKELM